MSTENKTALDILKAARELLSDAKRWGKHLTASDSWGNSVSPTSPSAHCWCVYGAIEKARSSMDDNDRAEVLLAKYLPPKETGISTFNDRLTTSHADILALFDRAIAAEERRA